MPSMLTLSGLCNSLTLCYACAVFALCCICTVLYLYLTVFGLCCIWTVFVLHCICNPLYVHSAVFALCCIWTLLRSTVFGLCWTRQFKVGAEGNYMCAAPRLWQLEICSTFTFKIIFTSPFIFSIFLWKREAQLKINCSTCHLVPQWKLNVGANLLRLHLLFKSICGLSVCRQPVRIPSSGDPTPQLKFAMKLHLGQTASWIRPKSH